MKAKDFGAPHQEVQNKDSAFYDKLVPKLCELNVKCSLLNYVGEKCETYKISIHNLICIFKERSSDLHVDKFIKFCKNEMTDARCAQVKDATWAQADSDLWYQMRYGRITASKMHEVAQCKTKDGYLVEVVFGASKFRETAVIKRGKFLEDDVRKEVSRLKNLKIEQSGLLLDKKWPIFGVSPDGLTNEYVIEIKCPYNDKTINMYYKDGKLGKKYYAQIQSQMHISQRKKGLFCIAHVDFESSKQVDVYEVLYDKDYCESIFKKCEKFWRDNIYDKLVS